MPKIGKDTGATDTDGPVAGSGDEIVIGDLTVLGTVRVVGAATLSSTLAVAGAGSVGGALTVTGDVVANGAAVEITGARDAPEEALANLLTALATLGLITDSTTAS